MPPLNTDGLRDDMASLVEDFHARCATAGLDLLVYCTRRTGVQQARIWRRGRSSSQIDSRVANERDYQGRILSGQKTVDIEDVALARSAEVGIPELAEFAPASTDAIAMARFTNWSLGCVVTVGPRSKRWASMARRRDSSGQGAGRRSPRPSTFNYRTGGNASWRADP
jgi:hypothetical protein